MKMESGRVASMQIQVLCVPGNLLPLYSSGDSYLLVQLGMWNLQKFSSGYGDIWQLLCSKPRMQVLSDLFI